MFGIDHLGFIILAVNPFCGGKDMFDLFRLELLKSKGGFMERTRSKNNLHRKPFLKNYLYFFLSFF
jgi:hypothetical protein